MSAHPGLQHGHVRVTVVEAPSCHFCADAHEALQRLADDGHVLEVTTVDVRDPAGQALLRRHGAALSPLVLVDGAFFSQGRLPRRKLARYLHQVGANPPTTSRA